MADTNVLPIRIVLDKSAVPAQAAGLRAELNRINKAIASDATAAAKEEAKGVAEAAKVKIDAQGRARDASGRFVETSKEGWGAVEGGILTASKAVGGFAAGMVGLSGASSAVSAVIEHFRAVNKSIYEAGEFVQGYRKALLELAGLKGNLGQTTKTLGEDIAFRSKTLQSSQDSIAFQKAALGVGQSGITAGLISETEFTKAMELGGAFQAAEGGSADAHATLIGLIPQLLGRKTTGEEVARKEAQLFNIFQPGGTDFSPLAAQYAKMAPLITSQTFDPMRGAALLSAFSVTNKEGPAEEVNQFVRGTIGNVDRTGKPRIKGASPVGDYYEKLGVTKEFINKTKSEDLAFAIADKIAADLDDQARKDAAMGNEKQQLLYLKHHGFANEEDTKAILHYAGMKKSGIMDKSFMALATDDAMPSLEQATRKASEFQRTDPRAQGMKADLAADAARVAVGAGGPEFFMNLQKTAFSRLKAGRELSGEYGEDIQNRMGFELKEIAVGDKSRVQMESQRMLLDEAKRVGVPRPAVPGRFDPVAKIRIDEYLGQGAMIDLAERVQAAGGTSVPGLEKVTGAAQKSLGRAASFEGSTDEKANEQLDLLRKIEMNSRRPAAPAPLLGAPGVPRR